jgi:ferredoxin
MTYIIAEPCRGRKDVSCVEVCPVDCIHPAPGEEGHEEAEMLFIDPEECIDCGACEEVCPVDACLAVDDVPEQWQQYIPMNADYFRDRPPG